MNSIWNKIFLLIIIVLLVNYSHGRYVSEWSTSSDNSLIDECLRKSLKYINRMQESKATLSDISKIVCKTQFYNGINIKLTFQLQEQAWECLLYKSLVQILSVQYEKCVQIDKENLPEDIPQRLESKKKNSDVGDDEAKIDKLRQGVPEEDTDQKHDYADEAKQQVSNEETNQKLDNKQSNNEEDQGENPDNNKEDDDEYDGKIPETKADNNENVNNDEQDDEEDKKEVPNNNGKDEESKQNLENQQKGIIDEANGEENSNNARALEENVPRDPEDE
jgi:hypothetical protein